MHPNYMGALGSAPHARGAVCTESKRRAELGISPARAGSRRSRRPARTSPWDQPRTRGEQGSFATGARHGEGSAPHARGAGPRQRADGGGHGISPARAGSRHCTPTNFPRRGDQPRTRGEQGSAVSSVHPSAGSAPHARGAAARRPSPAARVGISPARAGSSVVDLIVWHRPEESAPHARGAEIEHGFADVGAGISPARAGSSPAPGWGRAPCRNQPRTRGEQVRVAMIRLRPWESAPHARGAVGTAVGTAAGTGISPARAGSRVRDLRVCHGLVLVHATFVDSGILRILADRSAGVRLPGRVGHGMADQGEGLSLAVGTRKGQCRAHQGGPGVRSMSSLYPCAWWDGGCRGQLSRRCGQFVGRPRWRLVCGGCSARGPIGMAPVCRWCGRTRPLRRGVRLHRATPAAKPAVRVPGVAAQRGGTGSHASAWPLHRRRGGW